MAYQVTGNEYVSLPTIRESDGAVEGVTFLYMQAKGLLEIRGNEGLIPYGAGPIAGFPVLSQRNRTFASPAPTLRPSANGRWFFG